MAAPENLSPDTYEHISLEIADGIATIWLDRPDKMNAFTERMRYEIIDALDHTDADDAVRAVIFTGRGRAYCAGADLSSGEQTFSRGGSDIVGANGVPRDGGGTVSLRIFDSLKPVIGAINGPAVGVGVTMTSPMDVRLASTGARFGFVFSRRGIVPEAASRWFLPRLVGISRAMEWVACGEVFDAAEALDGGLVRALHEPDALLPAARELAHRMTDDSSAVSIAVVATRIASSCLPSRRRFATRSNRTRTTFDWGDSRVSMMLGVGVGIQGDAMTTPGNHSSSRSSC